MANVLAIDFDVDQLHFVSAQTKRKDIAVEKTGSWKLPESLTLGTAEKLGKALRTILVEQNMLASAVLMTLPRDQLLFKELRYPVVSAFEEFNLVRYQVGRELTEPLENFALDFSYVGESVGERSTLAVLAKRDLATALTTLCKAAGMKLIGIVPRYFGIIEAVQRAQENAGTPTVTAGSQAVLLAGPRASEIVIVEQGKMKLARALPTNESAFGELRRTLSVYAAQRSADPNWEPISRLAVFGSLNARTSESMSGLGVQVETIPPWTSSDAPSVRESSPGTFASLVGILYLWANQGKIPFNLAVVRKVQAPVSATRQRGMVYGGLGVLATIMVLGIGWLLQSRQQADLRLLRSELLRKETKLANLAQEKVDIEFLKDWEQASVPWLDELYDITARFPDQVGLRVNQLTATSAPLGVAQTKRLAKDQFVGMITVNGIVAPDQSKKVIEFNNNLANDKYIQAVFEHNKRSGTTSPEDFVIKINVKPRPPEAYTVNLKLPRLYQGQTPSTTEPMQVEAEDAEGEDR